MRRSSEMDLPRGRTCADCFHINRCTLLGYTSSPHNTWCDFLPVRFHEMRPTPTQKPTPDGEDES